VTGSTETSDQNLVVLFNVVQAAVIGDEGSDLLSVLDELNSNALSDSGVWLFSLNTDLVKDDSLGVGRASEGVSLQGSSEVGLFVTKIGPTLLTSSGSHLSSGSDTTWLTHCWGIFELDFC